MVPITDYVIRVDSGYDGGKEKSTNDGADSRVDEI